MYMSLEIEMYFELTNESVRKECTAGLKIINQVLQIGFCKRNFLHGEIPFDFAEKALWNVDILIRVVKSVTFLYLLPSSHENMYV